MATLFSHKTLMAVFITIVIQYALIPSSVLCQSENKRLNILFISSFGKDLPAQRDLEIGLNEALGYKNGRHNLFFEFMESPRLKIENFKSVFPTYISAKYQEIDFDVVVGWAFRAIGFLKDNKNLFPSAYYIYFENMDEKIEPDKPPFEKTLSFVIESDYNASLQEMFKLEHPKHLYVIGTTLDASARSRISVFNNALNSLNASVQIEYIFNQTIDHVCETLEAINEKDAVAFYLLMFSDGKGKQMTPYNVLQQLTGRSKIPIYSFWESLMGSGVVGGYVISQKKAGFLLGKTFSSLDKTNKVNSLLSMRHIYDWQAMKRWGISEDALPDEAIILNRPPDILTAYRWHILAIIVVIVSLSVLSFFLIRALKLRKIATDELARERRNLEKTVDKRTRELSLVNYKLSESEKKFRSLSDAAIEGIAILDRGIILEANNRFAKMFGYKADDVAGMNATDFIVPQIRADAIQKIMSDSIEPIEIMGLMKNGNSLSIEVRTRTVEYKDKQLKVVVIRDLTEKKRAEAEIKALKGILPICASCKKIKDDKGAWRHLEVYISKHSEAKLSHSLCPECADKLYSETAKEKE